MSRFLIRNSERQAWKKCRHRWQWTYLDHRQAASAPGALRFGTLVHKALELYYVPGRKRGPHPATTFERIYHEDAKEHLDKGFSIWDDEDWVDALPLGIAMLEGYVRRYAEEDKEYEVIASEQTFQLPVRVPARDSVPAFTVWAVGTFDGLWRNLSNQRLSFKEFKTATAISFDGLSLDEQAGMYWTYGPRWLRRVGMLGPDDNIVDIIYTFLRKSAPNPDARHDAEGHVLNRDGSISKRQPAPYFARVPVYRDETDRRRMHERVKAEARELWQAHAGQLYLYKNPGYLLIPNCRGCPVREACEVHEAGGDWRSVLDMTTVRWDPYEAHELRED